MAGRGGAGKHVLCEKPWAMSVAVPFTQWGARAAEAAGGHLPPPKATPCATPGSHLAIRDGGAGGP